MSQILTDVNAIKNARDDIKTALTEKGQTVGKDIRTYAEAIESIEKETVKQFNTKADLNNYVDGKNADFAMVHESTRTRWEGNVIPAGNRLFCPAEVTLPSAQTSEQEVKIDTRTSTWQGGIWLTPTDCAIYWCGEQNDWYDVTYTSTDGIHYTSITGEGGEYPTTYITTAVSALTTNMTYFFEEEGDTYKGLFKAHLEEDDTRLGAYVNIGYRANQYGGYIITWDDRVGIPLTSSFNVIKDAKNDAGITGNITCSVIVKEDTYDVYYTAESASATTGNRLSVDIINGSPWLAATITSSQTDLKVYKLSVNKTTGVYTKTDITDTKVNVTGTKYKFVNIGRDPLFDYAITNNTLNTSAIGYVKLYCGTTGATTGSIKVEYADKSVFNKIPDSDIVELKGETRTFDPDVSSHTYTPSSGKNGMTSVTINAVTSEIDSNIIAENIKKGVEILGVIGTYEGSDEGNVT